jgi:hypothetical protein
MPTFTGFNYIKEKNACKHNDTLDMPPLSPNAENKPYWLTNVSLSLQLW